MDLPNAKDALGNIAEKSSQGLKAGVKAISGFLSRMTKKEEDDRKIVLIVDDEVNLSDLVKFQLISKGYNVIVAYNGIEGLEKLKKITPDLIILDINMPQMGGLEFFNKISTGYGRSKYPVLFLTSRAELEGVFKDIQADGFLPKPFEIGDVVKEVERIIGGRIKPLIFLVDSAENPNAKGIKEAFESEIYEVEHVASFDQLKESSLIRKPKYVVLEYMQQEISGEEFIKRIKEDKVFSDVPIVVYSYSGFKECEEKSLRAGASKYLGKPQKFSEVVTAVKEVELNAK